ncbi:hypothetical protein AX768_22805 [Burkholderia sp. PAMC 28687]|nr:hypothetical protein AX768_22805 [Burkholderia sp. PAMC 28687]
MPRFYPDRYVKQRSLRELSSLASATHSLRALKARAKGYAQRVAFYMRQFSASLHASRDEWTKAP